MVHLPRIGPKVAAAPTDLDGDSQERLDAFIRMAGDKRVVSTRRLLWLAVVHSGPIQLGDRHSVKSTGDATTLGPHTVVMSSQEFIGVAKVNYYVAELSHGGTIKPVRVTDSGEGDGWWHLDGLHRLLAARILGLPVEANIWR